MGHWPPYALYIYISIKIFHFILINLFLFFLNIKFDCNTRIHNISCKTSCKKIFLSLNFFNKFSFYPLIIILFLYFFPPSTTRDFFFFSPAIKQIFVIFLRKFWGDIYLNFFYVWMEIDTDEESFRAFLKKIVFHFSFLFSF